MPLNQSLKGKTYQEVSFQVERDRVTQFSLAVGEDDPRFLEDGAARAEGFPEQLAFPTFPAVVEFLVTPQVVNDQDLGLDYDMVVHGEQEYEWKRPIVVGDILKAVPKIDAIYSKGSNEFLVVESEITDADGEAVCICRHTLLSRGTAGA